MPPEHEIMCPCDACVARRKMADEMLQESGTQPRKIPQDHVEEVIGRLEGAPLEFIDRFRAFCRSPNRPKWIELVRQLAQIFKSPEHTFSLEVEPGKVGIAFERAPEFQKSDLIIRTIQIQDAPVEVMMHPSNVPESVVSILHDRIVIFIDPIMSVIWGNLTYTKLQHLLTSINKSFLEEYSSANVLARSIKPVIGKMAARLKTELDKLYASIKVAEETIRGSSVQAFEKSKALTAIEQGQGAEVVLEELKNLLSTGLFSNLKVVNENWLSMLVKNVQIKWDGYLYKMGDYEARINIDDGALEIYSAGIQNVSERVRRIMVQKPHPHVLIAHPCLGNYTGKLTELVLDQKFAQAFLAARQFLCSYNPRGIPYITIEHFLPDRHYNAWMQNKSSKPWLHDDPIYHPGDDPGAVEYAECFKLSGEAVNTTGKLRCLSRPFGDICSKCPHQQTGMDRLYDKCYEHASPETCMKCGDLNCQNLKRAEDGCLEKASADIKKSGETLACVACPYNRADICQHGTAAIENCWSIQEDAEKKACGACTMQTCKHKTHEPDYQ